MKIGFIGQGWIGKHYADDFEARGYGVVRYARDPQFAANKDEIGKCDIVFIAVPTPTTPTGFDDSIVRSVIKLVGKGRTAVIKSTIVPGTTESIQKENPDIFVFHSPEFLAEATAAYDAAHPNRNIVGIPVESAEARAKAQAVLDVLPEAPYAKIMKAHDAELVKYAGNCFLFTKVIYMNLLHDLIEKVGGDWVNVRDAVAHDPRIGTSHTNILHQSNPERKGGRGAGGHCLIKDFEAFRALYEGVGDKYGEEVLAALRDKNIQLLRDSQKDLDLLEGVYGDYVKRI
jgi:UDPglucose 6-dehydrogenase